MISIYDIMESLNIPKGNQSSYIDGQKQHNGQKKMDKRKNDHLQTLHRKLEIEKHDLHLEPQMNSCPPER